VNEALLKRIIDPSTGLINDLVELQVNPTDPALFFYAGQLPDLKAWLGFSHLERSSAAGTTRLHAKAAAAGEAIERYAAAIFWETAPERVWASQADLGDDALPLDTFAVFHPEQITPGNPFTLPNPQQKIHWVRGHSLTRDRSVWVPAQFVCLPYPPAGDEPTYLLHVSSGTACSNDITSAIRSGLCEAIERDGFMMHWLAAIPGRRVDVASALGDVFTKRYSRPGIEYHVFDFSTDLGIPTYFCAVVEPAAPQVWLAVGAATRPDATEAIQKAVMESVQTRVWLRQMVNSEGLRTFDSWDQVRTFEDHVHLWGDRSMRSHLSFLLDSPHTVAPLHTDAPKDAAGQVDWLVAQLASKGLEAVVVDMTPPDVDSLGLKVVRCLVPGALPLSSDHRFQAIGGTRLYTVPQKLGVHALRGPNSSNPVPHPFP
jgi:ribosomal protein S12 methylthiotransferase accessory factor